MDDREQAIRAIAAQAAQTRKRPSRGLWIAALIISGICVAGLIYALVFGWDARPAHTAHTAGTTNGSGFGLGMAIGVATGLAIGSLAALRKR